MIAILRPEVKAGLEDSITVLKTPYKWRTVTSFFRDQIPGRSYISNVHVVPFVGENCVLLHTSESGLATPGGTLLKNEEIDAAVTRELMEEIGGEILRYELFGAWESTTTDKEPYRPWLPHPNFSIALGWADVRIIGSATSDGGVEQETVQEVVILPVKRAANHLKEENRPHLAALYLLAEQVRKAQKG